MNYFNFKNALIKKSVVEDGYKYTVTVDGKDIAAGSIQGLVNVLNELYHMPKTDILDEIFGDDFQWCDINPISYSAKIKAAIDIEKYGKGHIKNYKGLCFEGLSEEGNTVQIKKYGTIDDIMLQYAIDGIDTDWNDLAYDTPVNLAKGQKVYVRNVSDNDTFCDIVKTANRIQFRTTGSIKLSGNIQSIAKNGKKFEENNVAGTFAYLFEADPRQVNNISDASELKLPATELVPHCYRGLFLNNNLVKSPTILPAKVLTERCYYSMFAGCLTLETVPLLPATTLADGCYRQLFYNCSKLDVAPELPATTLANGCYYRMFKGCSKISHIKVNFIDWNSDETATSEWVDEISATGTFVKPAALEELRGISNIPEGWTIVNE